MEFDEVIRRCGGKYNPHCNLYDVRIGKDWYLLKTAEPDNPDLPPFEYLCNQIGQTLKLDIPECHIVEFQSQYAFLSKNFITPTNRVFDSFKDKWGWVTPPIEQLWGRVLGMTGSTQEGDKFLEMCLFDALIDNKDRHMDNIGFLTEVSRKMFQSVDEEIQYLVANEQCKLSPLYDNHGVSGMTYPTIKMKDHLRIPTEKNAKATITDYLDSIQALNRQEVINKFVKKIDIMEIFQLIDESALISSSVKKDFKQTIERNYAIISRRFFQQR